MTNQPQHHPRLKGAEALRGYISSLPPSPHNGPSLKTLVTVTHAVYSSYHLLFLQWGLELLESPQVKRSSVCKCHSGSISHLFYNCTLHEIEYAELTQYLQFGAVVAVSHATSPRRRALVFAANMTSIDLTIPDQPVWTDADLEAFHSPKGSRIKKGSALAWMGHLNALTWYYNTSLHLLASPAPRTQAATCPQKANTLFSPRFLSTDLETAIILEDDVDWDIHLRTSQVPLAAAAMRQLLTTHRPTKTPAHRGARSTYWGPLDWELLFLGHCGDIFPEPQLQESPFLAYADDSLMPAARLHTKTAAFLRRLGMPEHVRLAHRSHWPLCTFAYGVTRASARRILDEYSSEGDGGCQAFDVRVLEACRDHDWRCYTINPELFHHIEAPSEIANVDGNEAAEGAMAAVAKGGIDAQGRLQRQTLKGTPNIACGVRHPGFYTEDAGTLAWLKAVVGEQGVCLVDQMEEDMSRWP